MNGQLDEFVNQGWEDHGDDAAGVAARLAEALPLVRDEPGIVKLGTLAHHVYAEHLGAWRDGLAFLDRLRESRFFDNYGASGQSMRRWRASLRLGEGDTTALVDLEPPDRIRVKAITASALATQNTPRALKLFQQALEEVRGNTRLKDDDPVVRAMAVTGNNLAATLEEKAERTPEERELMILAAQTGREYWGKAGTWLETERAEHRLAMTWLAAGDPAQARVHAQACLDIIAAQAEPPAVERFFGYEALARAERAAGDAQAQAAAVLQAQAAFADLADDDKGWCQPTLDQLLA